MMSEFAQEARLLSVVALGVETVAELLDDSPVEGSALDEPQERADSRGTPSAGPAVHENRSQVGTLADLQPRANLLVSRWAVIRNREVDRFEFR